MASIVLLLSELLGGESASVLAANRYIMGGRLSLVREFRVPAVTEASAAAKRSERPAAGTVEEAREEKRQREEESFEDLVVSRIAVDVMWP